MFREPDFELLNAKRDCNISLREIGRLWGECASTVSSRLQGYAPMTARQRQQILNLIARREREIAIKRVVAK